MCACPLPALLISVDKFHQIGAEAIGGVVERTVPHRRPDLVFMQNGIIRMMIPSGGPCPTIAGILLPYSASSCQMQCHAMTPNTCGDVLQFSTSQSWNEVELRSAADVALCMAASPRCSPVCMSMNPTTFRIATHAPCLFSFRLCVHDMVKMCRYATSGRS